MITIKHRGTSDILVKIERGDTLRGIARRLTGNEDYFTAFDLVSRSTDRPNKPFKPDLIYPNDLFAVSSHLMLPVVAVDVTV